MSKKSSLLHRSRLDIIANVLQAAVGGAKKTHIMYQCNLSFKQLHAYLDLLKEMGLLESINQKTGNKTDSRVFVVTSKGKSFIKAYQNLKVLLVD